MPFRYRSCLMAALAFFCVLLCTSTSIHAEDDEQGEGHVVITPTAAEIADMQAADSQTVQTVPLATQDITPAEYNGDVRDLPPVLVPNYLHSWNEFKEPIFMKSPPPGGVSQPSTAQQTPELAAPMPAPLKSFAGLSFSTAVTGGQAGAGWPPDTNGDVGPVYYIQAVNDAWGIFNKTTGAKVAAFTEDQLWTPANTGTPCDNNNAGDPVAMHDSLADRWVLTNFAFKIVSGKPAAPFYQCFAVSKTNDPVAGGWYLYAVRMDVGGAGPPAGTLVDYPKFGLWTDCLYMGANGFNSTTGNYAGGVFAAFDRSALFSGAALNGTNSSVGFLNNSVFGLFPANLQGTSADSRPPAGTPEYFVGQSSTAYAFNVRKFQNGATACGSGSSLGGATAVSHTAHNVPVDSSGDSDIVIQPGVTTLLDSLGDEVMQRVVYRKIGAAESLWVVHSTCGAGTDICPSSSTLTQPQWVQINVSGGSVRTTPVQQQIYNPGGGLFRWMSSLAVDAKGDMAMGYSTSGSAASAFPSIAYAGRLVNDTLGQLPQTEVQLVAGKGSQDTCNTLCSPNNTPISRWGDYSAMVIDPSDDCTFWYTNLYYNAAAHTTGAKWDTQIGSFKFPGCVTYTVTASVSGGNGTITQASQLVAAGAAAVFTVTPNTGYHVATVKGNTCTVSNTSGTTWTSSAINQNCAVTATFAINTYSVTAVVGGGNGTVTPPSQTINFNSTASVTVTPGTGYHVLSVVGDTCTPVQQGATTTWTTGGITAACKITATFAINTYTVTASVNGANGTITPPSQTVNYNSAATFTVTPSSGFLVLSVTGDTCTVSNTSGTTWTSSAITTACAVSATFATTKLVFTQQPANLLRGSLLGTIQVTEKDPLNNTVDDNSAVDFTIAACGGTIDLGSVQMVHGVGTLPGTQSFYTVASGLQINANTSTSTGTSQSFAVNANSDIRFADGFESCRL